jgi:nitroreductase
MFLSLVRKRRSIREYSEGEIEASKIDTLIEAALRSPSSRGSNPWQFVVVKKPELLERLSRAKQHGSAFLREARLGLVVCANPGESDVWIEDCSIASTILLLAAESLGLGSCWIQIRERMHDDDMSAEEYVAETLGIPKPVRVASIIAIGYPGEEKRPHKKEELEYEKVFLNSYGDEYRGAKSS